MAYRHAHRQAGSRYEQLLLDASEGQLLPVDESARMGRIVVERSITSRERIEFQGKIPEVDDDFFVAIETVLEAPKVSQEANLALIR